MQISILRALNEISLLDKKINKNLVTKDGVFNYVNFSIGGKPPIGYKDNNECIADIKSHYQSVSDLIKRRSEIKSKIVESNAKTIITVIGQDMSVAATIEFKKSIQFEVNFLNQLKAVSSNINKTIEQHNNQLEQKIEALVAQTYSGKNTKINQDEYDNIATPFKKGRLAEIIDPLDIKTIIDKKEEYINEFERTINNILTESNATTMIEISDS